MFLRIFILQFLFCYSHIASFIVGGCIGPKSVLERFLDNKQKVELRTMVHTKFDGSNSEKVLEEVNRYVYGHVTEEQWHSIVPDLAEYQSKKHECSLYAQLLPKSLFQQLLKSVLRASEMGASKYDVKRLVDDYVERLANSGVLPDVVDKAPKLQRVVLPEDRVSQGYRNTQPKSQKIGKNRRNGIHPTLVVFPGSKKLENKQAVAFPIARPTTLELSEFSQYHGSQNYRQRPGHRSRMSQSFRRYPEHECDYYAGPCATSF